MEGERGGGVGKTRARQRQKDRRTQIEWAERRREGGRADEDELN